MDLLTEDTSAQTTEAKSENGVEQIAIDSIKAFHNHPFHLYEGERLDDMVESIREHGVLNPVIVLKTEDAYEMLSGHNIANAAKLAGLTEIPAMIVNILGLSEEEKDLMFNLAGRRRNTVAPDLPEYIMERDYVSSALRTARDLNASEEEWMAFVEELKKRKG